MSRNDLTFFNNFDLFDPFFNDDFFNFELRGHQEPLKTDIIENDDTYELIVDAPGVKKENIVLDIEDGYLSISVQRSFKDEQKKNHYIRKERHGYQAKRSFYVGNVEEDSIKAKFIDGELHIVVPKEKEKIITKKTINID